MKLIYKLRNLKKHSARRNIFVIAFVLEFILLLYSILRKSEFIPDCLVGLGLIGLFYLIESDHPLPKGIIVIGLLPVFLHSFGVLFGFFGMLIFGVGYDKFVHFSNSFAVTVTVAYMLLSHNLKHIGVKILAALLIAQGFGALNEVNEFVGSQYLDIRGPTMFSQGDDLPKLESDFQEFDTYWDMIFNLAGSLLAVLVITLDYHFRLKKYGRLSVP